MRIMVATKPVDFRKGHDGLAALVSSVRRKEPFTGTGHGHGVCVPLAPG
ncbi:IS66 family insertion sequence element accessory protein TnpB [Pseudogemmobacter bohemicus]|nr:IS66 family insertion sequence element accessory protein TnpB [Pseudogemmobacter bohemicus]